MLYKRATTMDSEKLEGLIGHSPELKSLPESVYQLNQVMQNPSVTISEIVDIVASDPVLSARILKSVNSPFYGFPSKIETIAYAVSILGIDSIRYLAISNAVISKFSHNPNTLISNDAFWRHSFSTAIIAQQLARICNHKSSERIFTTGLLHELGSLLLAITVPDEYKSVISRANSEHVTLQQAERENLGFTHSDVTAYLLKNWRLPRSIFESIQYIEHPNTANEWKADSAILNIADSLASVTYPSIRLANMDLVIQDNVWKIAGIRPQQLDEVLDELDHLVETVMKDMYFDTAA